MVKPKASIQIGGGKASLSIQIIKLPLFLSLFWVITAMDPPLGMGMSRLGSAWADGVVWTLNATL